MRRSVRNALAIVGGLGAVLIGFVLLRAMPDAGGIMDVLPSVLLGVGCGAFGYGAGDAISAQILKKDPELARELEIEQQDERRMMIAERSKARAFDMMTYALGALMLCFTLMKVDMSVVLLLVGVYLVIEGYAVYQMVKLDKEM